MIMPINNHKLNNLLLKYPNRVNLIPFGIKYNYLGVVINSRGLIDLDDQKAEKRSNYLTVKMKHYTRNLSFENQYLLWTTYIKPYF